MHTHRPHVDPWDSGPSQRRRGRDPCSGPWRCSRTPWPRIGWTAASRSPRRSCGRPDRCGRSLRRTRRPPWPAPCKQSIAATRHRIRARTGPWTGYWSRSLANSTWAGLVSLWTSTPWVSYCDHVETINRRVNIAFKMVVTTYDLWITVDYLITFKRRRRSTRYYTYFLGKRCFVFKF